MIQSPIILKAHIIFISTSFIHQVFEDCGDLINQVGEFLNDHLFVQFWVHEFHIFQSLELRGSLGLEEGEVYFVCARGFSDSSVGILVIPDNSLHHACSLDREIGTF